VGSNAIAIWTRHEWLVFAVKWGSSAIQILGYGATGLGWTPWNLYLFLVGVVGWFAVGALWNDKALMLVHLVALGALIVGMTNS